MKKIVISLILISFSVSAFTQEHPPEAGGLTNAQVNNANNPLARNNSIGFQNYLAPVLYGMPNESFNSFMIRPVIVAAPLVFRATIPVNTLPGSTTGSDPISGLSDINMFAAFLLTKPTSSIDFGIGPQLSFPTASNPALGTEKWQAGLAAVIVKLGATYMLGALATWQMSYAGNSERSETNQLDFQPFYVFQIGKGFTLKGTAIWTFDFVNGTYNVPFGLGVGKVILINRTVVSIGLEPQYTFLHNGIGEPGLQIFAGLSIQFPSGSKKSKK
ncbi:MAG: hypothetical protein WCO02_00770 [Bacteroidota bacterium]